MNDLVRTLTELAEVNYSGAVFLGVYGITWLVCALLWRKATPAFAGYATLFQGMVALPAALGLSAWLGILDARPADSAVFFELSMAMAASQMMVLFLLIVLANRKKYTLIPLIFSVAGAVHFVPFGWLYQTPVYYVMPVLLAIALAVIYYREDKKFEESGEYNGVVVSQGLVAMSPRGASQVCAATGTLFILTCILFVFV